jgi:beta-galactosidase
MFSFIQGVSYYPDYITSRQFSLGEDGVPSIVPVKEHIQRDFQRMLRCGISGVRMGEFCWSTIEPRRGVIDTTLFEYALDAAHRNGLSVIFCTPTACPPKWLIDEQPSILPLDQSGRVYNFGSRRHYDPLNPSYIEESKRIVTICAEKFGSHPAVTTWQVDNEFGHHGTGSIFTKAALQSFQNWLQQRYEGSIERLNEEWFAGFWSQRYTSFCQIELPRYTLADNNPHLQLNFRLFCTDAYRGFQRMQIDILRELSPGLEVTHNLNSSKYAYDLCPWSMTRDLDFVGFDHYQESDFPDPTRSLSNFTLMRSLRQRQFVILEQQPVQVNWQPLNRRLSYDWFPLWALSGAATGCSGIYYFSWQRFLGGVEAYHDGIIGHDVRVKQTKQEKKVFETKAVLENFYSVIGCEKVPVPPGDILVLVNTVSHWTHTICSQSSEYRPEEELDRWCELGGSLGLGVHCAERIETVERLLKYRIVVLAGYALEFSPDERQILNEYITRGGILISTPRTAMRTAGGGMSQFPLSILGEGDFHILDFGALGPEEQVVVEGEAGRFNGFLWIEDLECVSGAYEELGKLKDRFYDGRGGVFKRTTSSGGAHFHFTVVPRVDEFFQGWFLRNVPCSVGRYRIRPYSNVHILPVGQGRTLLLNYGECEQRVFLQKGEDLEITCLMREGIVLEEPCSEVREGVLFFDIAGRTAVVSS